MLVKGLVFAAVLASTPFAVVGLQAPSAPHARPDDRAAVRQVEELQRAAERDARALAAARAELAAARQELAALRQQLDDALDALEQAVVPQRERDCAPSRSRALLSHYRWLHERGHETRATAAVAAVVDRLGDDVRRLDQTARSLMTDAETAGRFDAIAQAIADRLEALGDELPANVLDTVALARFLGGQVDRAVALQRRAIEGGGRGDEFRRRLRTYEAAQAALAGARADANDAARIAGGE